MITFIDEKGTEHSALVAYSMTNAVNGELSVKGSIYTNDKVLHGIDRGWRFRLDDEYYRVTYAKPNDTGRQIEVEFDAVHQFFYDMSKSMLYDTLNGSKPFETYLQAIFSGSGYTYNLETTVGSIRKENFGNKSRLALFNDIIKAAGLEFSVRGHVVRILKRIGTDLSAIVRKDFNMNELKIEKNINSFVTYQRGLGAWKDDEDHSKGRYESEYESPLAKIYGRIEAEPVVDERYKETGKLLKRLKENVDKSYKVSVEIDMEDLSHAGYRLSRPNPGDYIMAINETLGFSQKVRIVSFTSEYDVGGNLISRKVVCNDIGTVQRMANEMSSLVRSNQDIAAESAKAIDTATRALISADGKNTIYFGESKPKDEPVGTFRKGDQLYLKEGEETRLYFWNGAEWELNPLGIDLEKFKEEFDTEVAKITKSLSDQDKKTEEALKASGANASVLAEVKQTLQQFDTDFANIRQNVEVNKKSVEDNLRGLTRRFEELTTATDSKLAEYAQTVDGRFTRLANQYADKTEFQKVQETSKLYERILGSTENDLTTKVSRLVMSNQIFQTEVSKFSLLGPNLIQNSCDPINTDSWGHWRPEEKPVVTISRHPFYFNGQKNLFYLSNKTNATVPATSNRFKVKRNTLYTLTLKGFYSASTKSITIYFLGRKKDDTEIYTVVKQLDKNAVFSDSQIIEKSYTFNSGEVDEAYIRLDNNGTTNEYGALFYFTEVDLYEGDVKRSWQAPPSDINILSTKVTQLLGSWSVRNLNSNGDIVSQINATGSDVRIQGESIHLNGKTLIDKAVIDGAAIKEMSADKITAGTLNAAKVKLINLDASSITTGTLDGAKANIININASSVKSGTFTGLTYRGGRMEALNGAMNINLNEADISFNKDAVINFNNKNNAIVRRKGAYTAFAHFADVEARDGDGGSLYAGFGVTSSNDGIKSDSGGRFSGIRCFRNGLQNGTSHTATIDRVEIYGDSIIFKDDFSIGRGFYFRPDLTKAYFNLNEMLAQFNHNFKHIINIIGGSHAIKTYDSYEIYRDFK